MNLGEMLLEVDTRVPNALSIEQKINWINQTQNQLYRDYPFPEAIHPFVIQPSELNLYPLPDECPEDRISHLMVDGEKYEFLPQGLTLDYEPLRFCTIVTGALLIHPVEKHTIAFLHFRPRYNQLQSSNLSAVPMFPLDYHELLVLGCAVRVAKTEQALLPLASILEQDFQLLAARADRDLKKKRQKKVFSVRAWA